MQDLRTHLPHDGDPCELCVVLRDVFNGDSRMVDSRRGPERRRGPGRSESARWLSAVTCKRCKDPHEARRTGRRLPYVRRKGVGSSTRPSGSGNSASTERPDETPAR